MALTTRVSIQGAVADYYERTIQYVDKKTGEERALTFRNFVLVGPGVLAEVRVPDELAPPQVGSTVRVSCTVGAYGGQPELQAVAYEEPVKG